jgi:hypothetical protein
MQQTQSASSVEVPRLGKILREEWHCGHSGAVPSAVCIDLGISHHHRRNREDGPLVVVQNVSRLQRIALFGESD